MTKQNEAPMDSLALALLVLGALAGGFVSGLAGFGTALAALVWLVLLALPATLFGAWLGARLYRVLSDRNFRDVVLGLLFLSGIGLVWSSL